MTNQITRFKLLYYLLESLGEEEQMSDDMDMLAKKIDEGNDERTETVLSYYEIRLVMQLDEKRRIDGADDIIKKAFE